MIFNKNNKDRAIAFMETVFSRNRPVKIEAVTESRTLSQNAYCWLVYTHVAMCTGNDKDDIYRLCLQKFGLVKDVNFNGLTEQVIISMSGMNKEQMSVYIDKCVTFFRQEGIDIPDCETHEAKELYNTYKQKGWI